MARWRTKASAAWSNLPDPGKSDWWGGLVDGMRGASGRKYMRNRYYDPATGQFTQTDPIGVAGGLNTYGFADGDPVSYADPYGLKACPESAGGDGRTDSYADCPTGSSGYYAYRAAQGEGGVMNTVRGVVAACREDTACEVGGYGVALYGAWIVSGPAAKWLAGGGASAATVGAAATGRVVLHAGQQGKHLVGHNNYIPGRSILTHANPQALLDRFAGTGQAVAGVAGQPGFKERVNFGEVIGQYIQQGTAVAVNTTNGMIHYSSRGAHIVPSAP